jgi:hypothetical protein
MTLKNVTVKAGTELPAHSFADDYPLAEGPPLWEMSEHIKQHGLQQPIVLYREDGKLWTLDGRRRSLACHRAKTPPHYVEFVGTKLEALAYVEGANLHRRHMGEADRNIVKQRTIGQRALLAGKSATADNGRPGNRANLHGLEKTLDEAAAEQGVSRRTAADGKTVVESGTEALQDAVIDGTVSVSDAAKVAGKPADVQNAALNAVRSGLAKSVSAAAKEIEREPGVDDDEQVVDAEGVVVPARVIGAFVAAEAMEKWCRAVGNLIKEAAEFAKGPGGRCLRLESLKQQLGDAKGNVWANRPTHVCPYCRGKEQKKPCEGCKGDGWVPRHVYQQAPKETGAAR